MYNCKQSIHHLLDFLDGDLAADAREELRAHLAGCAPCVEFLDSYRATPELCRRHLAEKMPVELATKLKDFLRAKLGKK